MNEGSSAPAAPLRFPFDYVAWENARVRREISHQVAHRSLWHYIGTLSLLLGVSVWWLNRHSPNADLAHLWPAFALPIIAFVVLPGVEIWGAFAHSRHHRLPHAQHIIVLEAEGLGMQCVAVQSRFAWAGLARVVETPEFLLFYVTPRAAVYLPKRAIPGGELAAVRRLIQSLVPPEIPKRLYNEAL